MDDGNSHSEKMRRIMSQKLALLLLLAAGWLVWQAV